MLRSLAKKTAHKLHGSSYIPLNRIDIYADRLLNNVSYLQRQHPTYGIIPVLKANAYGHGLSQVAEVLNAASCTFLAVDGYFEAGKLRHITRHPILVMGYIRPENVRLLDTKRCSFVIQDKTGLKAFGERGRPVRVHIELNTGMNRMGLASSELDSYLRTLKKYPNLQLEGVMTHLADADNPHDDRFTDAQVRLFDQLVEHIHEKDFQPQHVHIAQTAGSTKARSRYANAIRLGIGLYGINPLDRQDPHHFDLAGLQPVLELKSTIIKVVELQKGDRVSYNGIFTAAKPMRIGVLPVGYYEGIPRELSNVGCVLYGSEPLQIVGRVCMNHLMIDLGTTKAKVGTEITVISADSAQPNSVARFSVEHGLFPYALVTGIASSIRRNVVRHADKKDLPA